MTQERGRGMSHIACLFSALATAATITLIICLLKIFGTYSFLVFWASVFGYFAYTVGDLYFEERQTKQ